MRIRYGKPIKVKSLFGLQNIQSANISNTNRYFRMISATNTFEGGSGIYNYPTYKSSAINNEDYLFLVVKTTVASSNFGTCYFTQNTALNYRDMTSYKIDNIIVIKQKLSTSSSGTDSYHFRLSQPTKVDYQINYAFLLNASDLGLDHLTAEQFYNKYNKYFPRIATGVEVTIDDKVGQINLKEVNSNNVISCKVAGGSSDVYYGYNQKISPYDNTNHNGNAYNYDKETNTFTLTANSSITKSYFGLSCTKLTGMVGHKILFIGNIIEVSTATPFNDITGEWAMINITDRQRATGVGLTYCIGEWRDVTSNYVNMTTSTGFTIGDYFKIKDVQTIDLTDWFGAGKEPSTYEEFKERFTKEYYGFCPTPIKLTKYQIEALPNYGYNQLIHNGNFDGITKWYHTNYTTLESENNIGILTVSTSGATTTQINLYTSGSDVKSIAGHKYYVTFDVKSNLSGSYEDSQFSGVRDFISASANAVTTEWTTRDRIITGINTNGWQVYFAGGSAYDVGTKYYLRNIATIDLTEWYGEGNEPTTIEEFKATFPNPYYPYSQKRLLNKYMINKLQA